MDGLSPSDKPSDAATASPARPAALDVDGRQSEPLDAQATPLLVLDGFSGPLDHLLTLARAQTIDLASLSLTALLDQLSLALRQAPAAMPLGQKGDWLVMAAWLVQLRTRLLLPVEAPAQQAAQAEADQLRTRLIAYQAIRVLADWLAHRPQLGHEVFARGQPPSHAQSPERIDVAVDATQAVDVVEFLWASLALFDDAPVSETPLVYRPLSLDLYAVAEARARILQCLATWPEGAPLEAFLPPADEGGESGMRPGLRRRSGWASTFIAGLELTRQGRVVMEQQAAFQTIRLRSA